MSCCCKKNAGNYYARPVAGAVNPYTGAVAGAFNPYAGYGTVAGAVSPGYGPCPNVVAGAVSPYVKDRCDDVASFCVSGCPSDFLPNEPVGVGGISSPCYNNTDIPCGCSLRDVACRLINQRVIIHVEGCKMCVIIIAVGKCFIKAVNFTTNKVLYFNLSRVDSIEDILPRC